MSRHGMSLDQNMMDNDKEHTGPVYSGDQAAVMHDGIIVDDCFWRLFMDLPKVKLIFINDSCHSGSQYKVASPTIPGSERKYRKAKSAPKELIYNKYTAKKDVVLDLAQLEKAFGKPKNTTPQFDLISISGCQDDQTSSDAYLEGKYQGALTFALLSTLYNNTKLALSQQMELVNQILSANGFEQKPKLTIEGDQTLLDKPLF
jgi:hypothetical protein